MATHGRGLGRREGRPVSCAAQRFFGDVRVEIKARVLEGVDASPGEISLLFAAPEPGIGVNETDGYCLQFGADRFTSRFALHARVAADRRHGVGVAKADHVQVVRVEDEAAAEFQFAPDEFG